MLEVFLSRNANMWVQRSAFWPALVMTVALLFPGGLWAVPVHTTDVVDPVEVHPLEFVLARLSAPAQSGDRTIQVEDSSRIDPRALLLLKTTDGRIQEVSCVKSVREGLVKLTRRLKHDFPSGTYVVQASLARDRGAVGNLAQEGNDGSNRLVLHDATGIDALQRVVVESPDGRIREAHCIRWVEGNRITLADDLFNDYPPDSTLIQGHLIGDELASDKPCCCEGKGKKCCTDQLVGSVQPPVVIPPPLDVSCQGVAPSVVQGGSTSVNAVVEGADAGDVMYTWTVDGNPVTYTGDSFQLSPVDLSVGPHVVQAIVTAADDRTATCQYNFTVEPRPNRDPICQVIVTPRNVSAGETVRVVTEASDPDGDPLTYSWTLDEQPYPSTEAAWSLDTTPLSGGSHLARVAVRDGRGGLCSSVGTLGVREKIAIQIDNRVDNVAKAQLDEIALKLQGNQQLTATITGHTDSTGSENVNRRVGTRRAGLLRDYLVSQHRIDPNRIEVRSAGSSEPIASNLTGEGRRRNRRAEVELYVPGP